MKHNAWNPTRRNRNIGTDKSGFAPNSKFVVPERWADCKVFWERLVDPIICPWTTNGHNITMFVEPTKKGYVHASTPHDIVKVLELFHQEHLKQIKLIVLRQPKKKEEILRPVWGSFVYYADLGRYSGPAVYLESVLAGQVIKWGNRLNPYNKKKLDSLASDGHRVEKVKRGYEIHTSPATVRNTQLFRTLPHEIGHAVDYLNHSLRPSSEATSEGDSAYIEEVYKSKPSHDKEEYAHRYAREFYKQRSGQGTLPFDRIFDAASLV